MRKGILFIITLFTAGLLQAQDPIEVSPSSLDFGDVLMGNSPTAIFTISANLEQTVTITPPAYFTVNISEIEMTIGQTEDIIVTFTPPTIGTFNSTVVLAGSTFGTATVDVSANAINDLSESISGTLVSIYSPYRVIDDVIINESDTLVIEPGVELLFDPDTKMTINGTIFSIGSPENMIILDAFNENENWNGIIINSDAVNFIYTKILNTSGVSYKFPMEFESDGDLQYWITGENQNGADDNFIRIDDAQSYSGNSSLNIGDYQNNQSWSYHYYTFEPIITIENNSAYIRFYTRGYSTSGSNSSYYEVQLYAKKVGESSWESITSVSPSYESWNQFTYDMANYSNWSIGTQYQFRLRTYTHDGEIWIDNLSFDNSSIESSLFDNSSIVSNNSDFNMTNSLVYNCNNTAISLNNSDAMIKNTIIGQVGELGIKIKDSYPNIINSIIYNTPNTFDIKGGMPNIIYSIMPPNWNDCDGYCIGNNYNNYNECTNNGYHWEFEDCNASSQNIIIGSPIFESNYALNYISVGIDAGHPNDYDACMPPGLGTSAADIGMYGGMENCGTQSSNLPAGLPVIDNITDLPQDQGGFIGIQYQGSIFDYGHDAYDISEYSFWREMDVEGIVPENAHQFTRDGEYWELVGSMQSQGFENYGYSAPTLADSSSSGIFWSKYMIIAHTDDENIFFSSEKDSGYSVDNLPPFAPSTMAISISNDGEIEASWLDEFNPDIQHYEIYRNGNLLLQASEPEFEDTFTGYGDTYSYTIRGLDVNGNLGEFSEPFTATYGLIGDVTWDGVFNVLDVIRVVYLILYLDDGDYTEGEVWASDLDENETINVIDILILVDMVMSAELMESNNNIDTIEEPANKK